MQKDDTEVSSKAADSCLRKYAMHRGLWKSFKRLLDRFQLDRMLIADVDQRTGKRQLGFETEKAACGEDKKRAALMTRALPHRIDWTNYRDIAWHLRQRFVHLRPPNVPTDEAKNLIARLSEGATTGIHCSSLASSISMRELRLSWIGAVLELFDIYADEEICTFTILNRQWIYPANKLLSVSAASIKNQLLTHLRRAGVTDIHAPLVAFLHGEFEPTSGTFPLHFHGVTTKTKYQRILTMSRKSSWGYVRTSTGASPIRREAVSDRPRQFSYMLKSFWPQRGIRLVNGEWKRDRRGKRIHEPFSSLALLWLDRQSPTQIAILQDCRFMPNGQLRANDVQLVVGDDG
jgi:hypothetical protein